MGRTLFVPLDPPGLEGPNRHEGWNVEQDPAVTRPRIPFSEDHPYQPAPVPENDRALAAMIGIATLVEAGLWGSLLLVLF